MDSKISLEKTFTSVAEEIGVDDKTVHETSLMTTLLNLKLKLILEPLNGLVLMKSICLKTIVVSSQMLKTSR